MALVGVDAAIGEEAEEVEGAAILSGELHGAERGWGPVKKEPSAMALVDAGHVHADDASGAEVEVADLGVAHLAIGEADEVFAGAEQGVGELAEEACRRWACGPGRWRCRRAPRGSPSRRGW